MTKASYALTDGKIRSAVTIAAFTALIIIGAIFSFPVPWNPVVPFTLQTLFVILSGMILGPVRGLVAVALYIFIGVLGLPVFARGGSGFGALAGPSGGFLLGFLPAAFLSGLIATRKSMVWFIAAAIIGTLSIYVVGTPWLHYQLLGKVDDWSWASTWGKYTAPFLLVDGLKAVVAVIVTRSLRGKS